MAFWKKCLNDGFLWRAPCMQLYFSLVVKLGVVTLSSSIILSLFIFRSVRYKKDALLESEEYFFICTIFSCQVFSLNFRSNSWVFHARGCIFFHEHAFLIELWLLPTLRFFWGFAGGLLKRRRTRLAIFTMVVRNWSLQCVNYWQETVE